MPSLAKKDQPIPSSTLSSGDSGRDARTTAEEDERIRQHIRETDEKERPKKPRPHIGPSLFWTLIAILVGIGAVLILSHVGNGWMNAFKEDNQVERVRESRRHLEAGVRAQELGKMHEALREYIWAHGIDASAWLASFNAGTVYLTLGDYEAAERAFALSVQSSSSRDDQTEGVCGKCLYNLGMTQKKLGKVQAARESFRQASPDIIPAAVHVALDSETKSSELSEILRSLRQPSHSAAAHAIIADIISLLEGPQALSPPHLSVDMPGVLEALLWMDQAQMEIATWSMTLQALNPSGSPYLPETSPNACSRQQGALLSLAKRRPRFVSAAAIDERLKSMQEEEKAIATWQCVPSKAEAVLWQQHRVQVEVMLLLEGGQWYLLDESLLFVQCSRTANETSRRAVLCRLEDEGQPMPTAPIQSSDAWLETVRLTLAESMSSVKHAHVVEDGEEGTSLLSHTPKLLRLQFWAGQEASGRCTLQLAQVSEQLLMPAAPDALRQHVSQQLVAVWQSVIDRMGEIWESENDQSARLSAGPPASWTPL